MIRFIALFFLALTMQTASAQDYNKKEVCIRFRVASSVLDTKFADNEANLNNVIEFLNEVTNDTTLERLSGNLVGISINLCKSIQKELFINDAP